MTKSKLQSNQNNKYKIKIRATFYGIPCYFNLKNDELIGRNFVCDMLITIVVFFHQICNSIFNTEHPFPIKLDKRDLTPDQIKNLN